MRLLRLPAFLCLVLAYVSCKKDTASVDLSPNFYFLSGDTTTSALSKSIVLFGDSDAITFNIVVSSTYPVSKNTEVTIAVADTSRSSYNTIYGTTYQALPSNAYSFQTTFTATDSTVFYTIPVTLYKHALNVNNSYMLPISIVNASGNKINAGSSIIYLHTISSALAGIYSSTVIKTLYNGDAAADSVSERDTFSLIKNIIALNNTTNAQLDYADLGSNGWKYNLSLVGTILKVTPNEIILSSVESDSFKILTSTYNSTNNSMYIKSSYKNSNGNERIVEESLSLH